MAQTVGDIIGLSRQILQDTDTPARYTDADLLAVYNRGVREVRRLRPDVFYPDVHATLTDATALTDTSVIPEDYTLALAEWIAGWAELRDDQFTVDGRAAILVGILRSKLQGTR